MGRRLAFDRVNHQWIFYRICSVGFGDYELLILTQFLSNRPQHIIVDRCQSKLINVVSVVPKGSVLCPLLILLNSCFFDKLENKLIGYVNDLTLMAVCAIPGIRVSVVESLNRDLVKVSEGWDLWRIKQNASTTNTMIVSRSGTMHPLSPPLIIGGNCAFILVTLMYWERHLIQRWFLRSVSVYRAAYESLCILIKSCRVLILMIVLFERCFRRFCSAVLFCSVCSVADTYPTLLDRVLTVVSSLTGVCECYIAYRRQVAVLLYIFV